MFSTQEDTPVEQIERMEEQENFPIQEDTSRRYVLPPRANRGEKESRGSRYPMANIAKGNLSEEAKAFALSIVLISVAANKGWPLHQFDVKNAFLHGELKEEVYMEAPHGFTDRNDKEEITKLKKNLFTKFEMKDLGRLIYFLRIEVLRSKQGIFMYQKKYVLDLLAEIGHGVFFKLNGHLETQLYTDADWARDKGDRRSTSGYFTLVGGNLVTWRSKKQKVMALSSAEAEF
ncbi:putative ribonuclease H-like domain-containing protein [Tanacetum coccineum]